MSLLISCVVKITCFFPSNLIALRATSVTLEKNSTCSINKFSDVVCQGFGAADVEAHSRKERKKAAGKG